MSGWSKHHNPDRTLSIYNNGKFVAAIENTTASCDLFYQFSTEIKRLEAELDKLKRANEILTKVAEFYADHKHMNHGFDLTEDETAFVNEDDFQSIDEVEPNEYREHFYYVYGKRARKSLAEIEGMK